MVTSRVQRIMQQGVPRHIANRIAKASTDMHRAGRMEFRAQDGEAEILLYDFIGFDDFDGNGMSAKRFREELDASKGKRLTVRINSPGGDVWDGMAIYNMLSDHPGDTRVVVEGIAASAASLIAMAGDSIDAYQTSQLMIHDAWTIALGNEQELREIADVLDRIDGQMADVYSRVSGHPAAEWRKVMDKDSYLTAQEAKDKGLVDTVLNGPNNKARSKPRNNKANAERIEQAKLGLLGISASSDDTRERVRGARDKWKSRQPVNRNSERWISSIHEAGHATIAAIKGEPVFELGLRDDDGWTAAYCRMDSRQVSLVTVCAGAAAAMKARGVCWERPGTTGDVDDQNRIQSMLQRQFPYDGQANEDAREDARIRARLQADRLVNRHWNAIQQVASKLYSRGTLTGDDVLAMVQDNASVATK